MDKTKIKKPKGAAKLGGQGLPFKKEKGQHILKNPGVVQAIVEKSALSGSDVVMEVGPGTGNLSVKLMDRCKKLIAFEVDTRMVAELKKRIIGTPIQYKLDVITADVLKAKEWPRFDVCVANLPYQISSPFVFRLLAHRPLPRYAVLMFQKEFADRLLAKPGSKLYCRLSVSVQFLAKVEHLMRVKRSEFRPPPKVDSAVVRIEPRNPPPPIDYEEWDVLLRLAFLRKNKTFLSLFKRRQVLEAMEQSYRAVCSMQNKVVPDDGEFCMRDYVENILRESGFADKRARTLSLEGFLSLLLTFNRANIHFRSM